MKGFGKDMPIKKKNMNNITKLSKEQIINQAFTLHSQGNIREATKYYQNFIAQGFQDYRAFSNLGLIYRTLGKSKEAENLYRKAIKINPNYANAYFNLGSILQDLGKSKEAEDSYRKAIEINPNFSEAYCNLGKIFIDLRKSKEAELLTLKAIEINPNYATAHSNMGVILKNLGKLKEAEISYRKAIKFNPNYANAYLNLGSVLQDLGKSEEAETIYRKSIELNPNFALSYSNLGKTLKDLGKLEEAELFTRKAIAINPDLAIANCNLGGILKDLGKIEEAELFTRKAIAINPDLAIANCNLGGILKDLGKLEESAVFFRKSIKINPDLTNAYFSLSTLQNISNDRIFCDQLFSESILNNKSIKDKIDIYFARANILHKEKKYDQSSLCLKSANQLKLKLYPSDANYFIDKSQLLLIDSDKNEIFQKSQRKYPQSIFIVGMPRSGSTLLESILSINDNVDDLGEINILEDSFFDWKKDDQRFTLSQLYLEKIRRKNNKLNITTNKYLYNYQYVGIIGERIPNAKIIHCYRNPLDNILSIYREHFAKGNQYSSSLVDCARVYLDQENTMTEYKNRFGSKIYDMNYDLLVSNPNQEIKDLISWLGWEWLDLYLSPHLNPRSVSTASNVQVRYPINSKSIGGWKNYTKMLQPAIEILTNTDKYRNITS